MNLLLAVASGFLLAPAVPWLHRAMGSRVGYLVALLPVALVAFFAQFIGDFHGGSAITSNFSWIPQAQLSLSFHLDGLSLFFVLLIAAVGALVSVYSSGYLRGNRHAGPFFTYMLAFMASMLGLVLAGNVILLYVFWELTTLTSFLLIGFEHERTEAREAAIKSLMVTAIGGLAMLVGLLLLGQAAGTFQLAGILERGDTVRADSRYPAILALILLGAFTKSAQFPFHFWLPAAMEAPAPVSAYLHSATMVKAGVYLLARLTPVLGGTDAWLIAVTSVGAVTMLVGATLAFFDSDLKGILAYLTISILGALTMLLGIGTNAALDAAMTYLLAHAFYKGALFLIAGTVAHETGTRDVHKLGGLRQKMPLAAGLALVSALSMAGVAPLYGFIAKEELLTAVWEAPLASGILTVVVVVASLLLVAGAGLAGVLPFFGRATPAIERAGKAEFSLWISPLVLTIGSVAAGLLPQALTAPLIEPAVGAIARDLAVVDLKLWHGFNVPFVLSMTAMVGGIVLYLARNRVWSIAEPMRFLKKWGPNALYGHAMAGLLAGAGVLTRTLQSGYLRRYVLIIVATAVVLVGVASIPVDLRLSPRDSIGIRFHEAISCALILLAALVVVRSTLRFRAITALGVIGFNVAWLFNLFGAPDLAMTQLVIESTLVLLFVFSLYRLPSFTERSSRLNHFRDAACALAAGGVVTAVLLLVTHSENLPPISEYYAQQSLPLGHGRNVVNVILVDFRALDTFGEITVLAMAAIGVLTLTKLVISRGKSR